MASRGQRDALGLRAGSLRLSFDVDERRGGVVEIERRAVVSAQREVVAGGRTDVQIAGDGGGEVVLDAVVESGPGVLVLRVVVVGQVERLQRLTGFRRVGVEPLFREEVESVGLGVVAGSEALDVGFGLR